MEYALSIAGPVLAVLISISYTVLSNRSKVASERVAKIEQKVAEKADAVQVSVAIAKLDMIEDRVTHVEAGMKHLPDNQVTLRLERSIAEMRTEVSVLAERMKPISAISVRLQEAILERANET